MAKKPSSLTVSPKAEANISEQVEVAETTGEEATSIEPGAETLVTGIPEGTIVTEPGGEGVAPPIEAPSPKERTFSQTEVAKMQAALDRQLAEERRARQELEANLQQQRTEAQEAEIRKSEEAWAKEQEELGLGEQAKGLVERARVLRFQERQMQGAATLARRQWEATIPQSFAAYVKQTSGLDIDPKDLEGIPVEHMGPVADRLVTIAHRERTRQANLEAQKAEAARGPLNPASTSSSDSIGRRYLEDMSAEAKIRYGLTQLTRKSK